MPDDFSFEPYYDVTVAPVLLVLRTAFIWWKENGIIVLLYELIDEALLGTPRRVFYFQTL